MHAYIIKRNRYFFNKKRFIVLTNNFIYNCEAEFTDKECKDAKFTSNKWRVPIKAMTKIDLMVEKEFIKLSIHFDLEELNQIMMQQYSAKKP